MARAKIMLSPTERQLVVDAGWILTKNAVIEKVYALFGQTSAEYGLLLDRHPKLKTDAGPRSPKISKGEQYEGLPWVMLDHPRNFSGQDAFAIRSFFWWGNFCSITLQLSGAYLRQYSENVNRYLAQYPGDWLVCTGEDAWEHHLRADRYVPATTQTVRQELPFLKIAKKIPLQEWDRLPDFFCKGFEEILVMLEGSADLHTATGRH
ncbi:hypothetical protein [Sediminibacterium soli]|uniref:hypothetical protein n=1 Tax=Sediminibacterium soli TaxID=2698829 RepID=UPI00137B127F|nr:hypothetical protein [Sediminibacterium soli]NCI47487.1 hypothetical protein [Sediminibacterium soli]